MEDEGGASRPRRPSGQGGGGGLDKFTREELVTKCRSLLLIAQKAKAAKDEANAELKKIKSSSEQNTSQSDALREMVEDLTEGKMTMTSKSDDCMIDEIQIKSVTEDPNDEPIESLQRQLKLSTSEVDSLRAAEEELLMKIRSLQSENTTLVKEKQDWIIDRNTLEEKVETLEAQNTQIDILKKKIKKLLEEKTKLEENLSKTSKAANELSALKQEKMASDIIVNEVKMQNKSLEVKLKSFGEVKKQAEDMKNKIKEMENKIEEDSNKRTELETHIQELKNEKEKITQNLFTSEELLEKNKQDKEENEKSNEARNVDADEKLLKFEELVKEKQKLEEDLAQKQKDIDNSSNDIQNIKDDNKAQLQELENKLKERDNKLETFETDLERVGEERDSLTKDVADFKMKIKIIEDEKSALDTKFTENKTETENRLKLMEDEKEKAGIVANEIDTLKTQSKDLNMKVSKLEEESKIAINYVGDMMNLCRSIFPSFVSQINDIENHENPVLCEYLNSLKETLNMIREKRENLDFDKRLNAVSKFADVFMEKYAKVFEDDNVNLEDTSLAMKNLVTSLSEIFNEMNSLLDTEINSNHIQKLHDTFEKFISIPSDYVERIQKQMNDISLEKNTVCENLSSVSSEVSQLRITVQEKTDAIKEYSEACDKHQKEKQSLESFVAEIKEKNECLEKELNNAVKNKKCTEERVTALESQITSGDSESEEIINNLRREVATIKTTKDESNVTQKQLQEELSSLKREKEEANSKHKQMQNELASEKGRSAGIESELKSEILSLTDTNKHLGNQRIELEEKYSTMENQLEDLRGSLQRSQEAVEMYQQESQALNLASEASDKSLQESEAERSKMEASVQESTARCEELLTELNQMNQVLRERGERISRLEAANKDKTQELETKTTEINQLVKKVETVESDLKNKRDQLEGLNQKLATLNTEVSQSEQTSGGQTTEDANVQMEQFQAKIQEKDTEIQTLKTTIANLEGELSASREAERGQDNQSEMMSTSTMSRVEDTQRMKEIEDTFEERYMKLKSVAIKLKKRVAEMTAQLNMSEEKRKKLELEKVDIKKKSDLGGAASKTIQALTIEVDRLQDSVDIQKKESKEQNKSLKEAAEQLGNVKSDYANCMEEKDQMAQQCKKLEESLSSQEEVCTSLRAQILILEKRISTEEEKYQVIEERRRKAAEQVEEERQISLQLKKGLEDAQQESKNNSMIDLEMRDYEQTVEELNTQLAEKDTNIALLRTEFEHEKSSSANLQEQLDHLTVQGNTERERAEKMKKLLLDHKTELAELRQSQDIKTQQTANDKNTIEKITQDQERQKLVMSEISAEKTKMEENAMKAKTTYEHKIESLEQQVSKYQTQATQLTTELAEVKQEFEVFKTRAHSVLQKKAKSPDVDVLELKSEKDQLVADLDSRQALLQQLQSEISTLKAESSFMIAEKRNLERQVSNLGQEMSQMEATYKDKLATTNAKAQAKTTELQLMIANMASQNEAISKSFKSQLESLQNSHLHEVESVQTKLEETEDKLWQLKNTVNTSSVSPGTTPVIGNAASKTNSSTGQAEQSSTSAFTSYHRRQPSHGNDEPRIDITNMIREQGEGSEWVEPSRGSPRPPHHGYSPPSLEQLISAPLPTNASTNSFDDNASMASYNTETTTKETIRLETKISALEQRVHQLTTLLHESEAENAKLSELSDALKEEIRRSSRNEQREKHMENVEYIKNVILKFLLLKNSDERCRLVPVLKTVLQLSPQEASHIEELAKGGEGNTGAAGSGWGSYLHMWSGR